MPDLPRLLPTPKTSMTTIANLAVALPLSTACGVDQQQLPEPIPKDQLPTPEQVGKTGSQVSRADN